MKPLLLVACVFFSHSYLTAHPPLDAKVQAPGLYWHSNYLQALSEAKAKHKFLVLFFTDPDRCAQCKELEVEALFTPAFADMAAPRFVFLKVELPMDMTSLSEQLVTQNKSLRKKYDVRTYPTLILLDPSTERVIGCTGYRAINGSEYARHLLKMTEAAASYQQQLRLVASMNCGELERLYQKAKQLNFESDKQLILSVALKNPSPSLYFLIERFQLFAREGKLKTSEAQHLKQKIMSLATGNLQPCHLQIAVIEFETYCEELKCEHKQADLAVAPLVEYLERFGKQDAESAWRLSMLISQVFLDANQYEPALKYAQNSYQQAPASMRADIASAIQNIQAHLHP